MEQQSNAVRDFSAAANERVITLTVHSRATKFSNSAANAEAYDWLLFCDLDQPVSEGAIANGYSAPLADSLRSSYIFLRSTRHQVDESVNSRVPVKSQGLFPWNADPGNESWRFRNFFFNTPAVEKSSFRGQFCLSVFARTLQENKTSSWLNSPQAGE